jgi:hypothetical protein
MNFVSIRARKALFESGLRLKASCLSLLVLLATAVGQANLYPHNAISCESCHRIPSRFGASPTTVQRIGSSIGRSFFPSPESGIHHRIGESALSLNSAKPITGDRISVNLRGDGYIEAINSREHREKHPGTAACPPGSPGSDGQGSRIRRKIVIDQNANRPFRLEKPATAA